MSPKPFVDIHSHHHENEKGLVKVLNLFPGDEIPAFTGNNYYSIGLHPWKIKTRQQNDSLLKVVEDALRYNHVLFVGECGLDKITGTDFKEQKRVFVAQALLAETFQKPMVIHCVKAYNEIYELCNSQHPSMPWILHGYTGNSRMTQQLSKKTIYFSFGKILFKQQAKAIDSFKKLPLERIFIESDEFKGPLEKIYAKAAEIRNVSVDELKKTVWANFNRLKILSLD